MKQIYKLVSIFIILMLTVSTTVTAATTPTTAAIFTQTDTTIDESKTINTGGGRLIVTSDKIRYSSNVNNENEVNIRFTAKNIGNKVVYTFKYWIAVKNIKTGNVIFDPYSHCIGMQCVFPAIIAIEPGKSYTWEWNQIAIDQTNNQCISSELEGGGYLCYVVPGIYQGIVQELKIKKVLYLGEYHDTIDEIIKEYHSNVFVII